MTIGFFFGFRLWCDRLRMPLQWRVSIFVTELEIHDLHIKARTSWTPWNGLTLPSDPINAITDPIYVTSFTRVASCPHFPLLPTAAIT